ncbi:phosphate acyltransferase, partial [Xanthomonas vasicola]
WISRRSVRKWRPATYRAYNLVRVFTDGVAIGPILMGISKPVHILTTSVTSRRVMNMTAIAAVDAQIRRQRDAEKAAADKAGE